MPSVRVLEASVPSFRYSSYDNTPAATPTDLLTLKGAAGKIIKVRRIVISGIATTAGNLPISIIKRTAANTGGTSTAPTPAKADSGDSAAAAAVLALYTANPSGLGAGTTLVARRVFFNLTTAQLDRAVFEFGKDGGKPIYLRGASEWLAINGNGAALPAGCKIDFDIEWTE